MASCPHTPGDPQTDQDVLILLYCAADGPNWTNTDDWLTDELLNNWHGVTASDDGKVISLILVVNQLNGTILGSLTNLLLYLFGRLIRS